MVAVKLFYSVLTTFKQNSITIWQEKKQNWTLKTMTMTGKNSSKKNNRSRILKLSPVGGYRRDSTQIKFHL